MNLRKQPITLCKRRSRSLPQTWEKCIAATAVHYINDVIYRHGSFPTERLRIRSNFVNLAKHWGEMKGFALGLQFSALSPLEMDPPANQSLTLKQCSISWAMLR